VVPEHRGHGLGKWLLDEALAFAREAGYRRVTLWTVDLLRTAARLYADAGFRLAETRPGAPWGVPLTEQRYDLDLR
jgi:GNAT superfamily N-acetyltransferase